MNLQQAAQEDEPEVIVNDFPDECSRRPSSGRIESNSEDNFMGEKYQDLVARFKRKMEQQVLQKAATTCVSSARNTQSFQRIASRDLVCQDDMNMNASYRPHEPPFQDPPMPIKPPGMKKPVDTIDVFDEEIIVLPPPPVEFRDGIIPSCGRLYSLNSNV